MGVPKQAVKQAQQAEEAMKKAQQRDRNPPPPPADNLSSQPQEKPEPKFEEPKAPTAPADAGLREKLEREIQLRKTLEGRLKSQLKPANEENRRLRKELEALQKELKEVTKDPEKTGVEKYLSDDEKQELGDVLDVNARMVKGILEEELGTSGINKVVDMIMTQSEQQKETKPGPSSDFWPIVDNYCPGAREMNRNNDSRWLEFLKQYNSKTGTLNREIAEAAFEDDDPIGLAELFIECKRQFGMSEDLEPADEVREPSTKPEKAARQTTRPGQIQESEPGKWTRAEVTAFYTDVAMKRFKGTADDKARLEAEIMAAAKAGRITP